MPDTSRAEKLIADLREYDTYLDAEKARIRPLLNAINGVETRTNTTEILQEMFLDNPTVEYTAADAEAELAALKKDLAGSKAVFQEDWQKDAESTCR